jgi:hypothetical protein
LIAASYIMNRPRSDASGPADGKSTAAVADASPSAAPASTPGPVSPDVANNPPASADATRAPRSDTAADSQAAKSFAVAVQNGQQQLARGELRLAVSTAAQAVTLGPAEKDPRFERFLDTLVASTRRQAEAARTAAGRVKDAPSGRDFRIAQTQMDQAARLVRTGRRDRAAAAFLDAADLFARAEQNAIAEQLQASAAAPPAATPAPPVSRPPSVSEGASTAAAPPPSSVPPEPTPPLSGTTSNVTPPAQPPQVPVPAPSPPQLAPRSALSSDEDGIRAALRAYEAAYNSLDVAAVRRLYPAVNETALERSFRALVNQDVRITVESLAITGTTATVRAQVRQSFTPKVGTGRSDVLTSEFRLQKMGDRWIILQRR